MDGHWCFSRPVALIDSYWCLWMPGDTIEYSLVFVEAYEYLSIPVDTNG